MILFAALSACVCVACSQDGKKYTVKGTAPEDGALVYLVDLATGNPIDSAVVADGAFVMKGVAAKDALLNVKPAAPKSGWKSLFLNDGTPVTVNLTDSTLTGSPTNTKLAEYCHQIDDDYQAIGAVVKVLRTLPEAEQASRMSEYRAAYNKLMDDLTAMVEENQDNNIPVGVLGMMGRDIPRDKFVAFTDSTKAYATHPYIVERQRKYAEADAKEKEMRERKQAVIGKPFLDLQEADPSDKMHSLSEYVGKGKWVLVDFWASWCGPCKAEMPHVVAAYKQYHKKGFDIVGVSFDSKKENWVKAIKEWEMPWIHISDLKGWGNAAHDVYTVNAIPDNLLIDPQGTIVARGLRGKALADKLAEVLK